MHLYNIGKFPNCLYGIAHGSKGPQCSAPMHIGSYMGATINWAAVWEFYAFAAVAIVCGTTIAIVAHLMKRRLQTGNYGRTPLINDDQLWD